MKFAQKHKRLTNSTFKIWPNTNKLTKNSQRLLKFGQSGEIAPNLGTLKDDSIAVL